MTTEKITAYKAFNDDWTCRGFQYEVGKTYTHDGEVKICHSGFHACLNPIDMLTYYPLIGSRFAEVEMSGYTQTHDEDSKICGAVISVRAEVKFGDLIPRVVDWVMNKAKHATSGNYSPSATSGNYSPSATSGDRSPSATSGYSSPSATSGNRSHSATNGDDSHSATSGKYSHSATSGHRSPSEASGKNSVAAAIGFDAKARAGETGGIALAEYDRGGKLVAMFASLVGENGIKPGVWYELKGGKPVEVSK